jgi:hypothetical protein
MLAVREPGAETIYFEMEGKYPGVVSFTFEMIEGLKMMEEEQEGE